MEDDFDVKFAEELQMLEASPVQPSNTVISRKRQIEDKSLSSGLGGSPEHRLKIPRLSSDSELLQSTPEDRLESDLLHDEYGSNASDLGTNNLCSSTQQRNGSTYYEEDGASELKSSSVSCPLLRSCVLKRAPPGAYVTVTSSEGDRVYLRLKSEIKTEKTLGGMLSSTCGLQLLTIPFSDLKDDMEEERQRKLAERSSELLQSLRSKDDSQMLFDLPEKSDKDFHDHLLWVDKYSPKHYTELLSDDGLNRTLLSWLKLWDQVVFGRPVALRGRPGSATGTKGDVKREVKKISLGKKFERIYEYQDPSTFSGLEALDENGRPKIKLALLCGAPGLGKTTLAHIIARHAGYNVVEMNASDDRSPEIFAQKIESSTQMQAVLTPDTKPNCLIIDEIDGAPTAAINVLVDLVKKKDTTTAKKKKGGLGPLSRPIICICNDQYAPSLRQLRQHALLLYFPPTMTARLASRLHQVVKREKMSSAMSTLMALCEKSDNDIRSCLNTLQFLCRKQKNVTLALVQGTSVGQKDAQKSLFSLWKEIFQLPAAKKHTLNQGPLKLVGTIGEENKTSDRGVGTNFSRFYNILSAAMATGEHEKVANGLFENYLSVKFKDPNLEAISIGQDWIVFHNELQQHIAQNQNFAFMAYLPYLPVAFHFLFAAPSKAPIRYPNAGYEAFLQQNKNSSLLTSLLNEVPPCIRRTITPTLLVTELLPPFTEILAPIFRPVSTQLFSSQERQQLVDLVGTMISYSLTFRQDRGMDGQYTYVLEPNIEELTHFPGLPQKRQLSYSAKQLIAREIEVEKLRRAEVFLTKRSGCELRTSEKKIPVDKPQFNCEKIKLQKQTVAQAKEDREQHALDFFGRKVSYSSHKKSGTKGGISESSTLHSLWFKFNEGFSNAVRRPMHVKDLL